jgi:PBSX family phage terminase large subunit
VTTINFDYAPLPIHADFHRSNAYERQLFGAFGSGKTYGICAEAIAWCLEQPGIRGLITRRTVPELRDTTETVFFDILPDELFRAGVSTRSGGHYSTFTFPNGSQVLFRSIDDWNKHKSLNVGFIAWDELDEFDEETYMGMSSRVRQRDPTAEGRRLGAKQITRRGMWAATNPHGHDWVYKRFVDGSTKKNNTAYWRSTSFDNPYLPPEYLESLLQYPEPWIRRYVLCQFDDFAGQIYEDWNWDTHTVALKDLNFDSSSVYWHGMDPGTRSPTAGLWVCVDQANRRLVGVSEYQETFLSAAEHAKRWREIEARKPMRMSSRVRWRVADPSITTRDRGTNMGLDDQYRRLGYSFQLGPKQHKDRIPMLGQLIHLRKFVVCRELCPQTYEQIRDYKWEDLTPTQRAKEIDAPERPLKKNEHLVDCAQYLSSRWSRPMADPLPRPEQSFSDEVHRAIRKQMKGKRRAKLTHDLGSLPV